MFNLPSEELPVILTVSEVADILRINKGRAYEIARLKSFPSIKIGRSVRVPRDAFFKWLENSVKNEEKQVTNLR